MSYQVHNFQTGDVIEAAPVNEMDAQIQLNETNIADKINSTEKGAASGVATLDSGGKVPTTQLPSYVDDVIEGYYYDGKFYVDSAHTTEIAGESGKIYDDLPTGDIYRWGGSVYVQINNPQDIIDDTAGEGDTGKTWSANAITGLIQFGYLDPEDDTKFYKTRTGYTGSLNGTEWTLKLSDNPFSSTDIDAYIDKTQHTNFVSFAKTGSSLHNYYDFLISSNKVQLTEYSDGFTIATIIADQSYTSTGTLTFTAEPTNGKEGLVEWLQNNAVITYNYSDLVTGNQNFIYVDKGTGTVYKWNGTSYESVVPFAKKDGTVTEQHFAAFDEYGNIKDSETQPEDFAKKQDTELSTTLSRGRKANTTAGTGSLAFGNNVEASGDYSSARGNNTAAKGENTEVFGRYNVPDTVENTWEAWQANTQYQKFDKVFTSTTSYGHTTYKYYICKADHTSGGSFTTANWELYYSKTDDATKPGYTKNVEIVGNGYSASSKSNARSLDWQGNEYLMGDLFVECNMDGTGGSKVAKESDIPDISGKADKVSGATSGDIATLDGNGNLTDSGKKFLGTDLPMSSSDNTKVADNITSLKSAKADIISVEDSTEEAVKTITDGADDLPMSVTVGIEPVQDLHGYDNPWPGGGNINLADLIDNTAIDSNGVIIEKTGRIATVNPIPIESGVSYVFKAFGSASSSGALNGIIAVYNGSTLVRRTASITPNSTLDTSGGDKFYFCVYGGATGTTANVADAKAMIVRSTATVTEYSPYSNICPITGWTGANISGTGKNLVCIDNISLIHSTAQNERYGVIFDKPGTYTVSGIAISDTSIYARTASGDVYGNYTEISTSSVGNSKTYTVHEGERLIVFNASINDLSTAKTKFAMAKIQVEFGSSATSYADFGNVYPITFPDSAGTVYGGTLTVFKDGSGLLSVDTMKYRLDQETLASVSAVSGANYFLARYNGLTLVDITTLDDKKCSHFKFMPFVTPNSNFTAVGQCGYVNATTKAFFLTITQSTAQEWTNYLTEQSNAGTPVEFIGKRASPTEIPLTAQQIRSLLGTNNIWANTGNVLSVDYSADTKLYVDRQVSEKVSASQRLMELIVTANREDSMKATQAYSSGDLLIVNGTLYKASTSIANGATLTVGTNVTATTVAAEIAALA